MNNVTALTFPGLEEPTPPAAPAARPAPTVAYESEHGTVYHGHAEDLLPLLPTESVDLIATDPPYGVDWQSRRRAEAFDKIENDGAADRDTIKGIIGHCVRLVRQQRHLYVFGPEDALEGQKVSDVVELVWDKGTMNGGNVRAPWGPQHERINFTVSKHRHAGKAGQPVLPTRMRKGSILSYTRPTGTAVRHQSEKPVPLMRELIESSSRQGETVLDPFGGVLSTAVAAVISGRRFLTIESDLRNVEVGIERIEKAARLAEQLRGL